MGGNMKDREHEHEESEMGMALGREQLGACDRLSFSLGSPKSGVGHGIAFPRRASPF